MSYCMFLLEMTLATTVMHGGYVAQFGVHDIVSKKINYSWMPLITQWLRNSLVWVVGWPITQYLSLVVKNKCLAPVIDLWVFMCYLARTNIFQLKSSFFYIIVPDA